MKINELPLEEAHHILMTCCSCENWSKQMLEQRPFINCSQLIETAHTIWFSLDQQDWMEAFKGHPRIGDLDSLKKKYANTSEWAKGEQAGVIGASEQSLMELKQDNEAYVVKFGYIFLVNATGKGVEEILAVLKKRLLSSPEDEIKIAATEQSKITEIRLKKLL